MPWKPLCLAGSDVHIIVMQGEDKIYALNSGHIFVFGKEMADQFANRATKSNTIGDGMSWHYKGVPDNLTLYLRDKHQRVIGMIRLVQLPDGKVKIFHHDEYEGYGPDTKLDKHGTYAGMDLIGRLRELADNLTGALAPA